MRQESRVWNDITATLEIITAGVGVAGLTPTAMIRRRSDANYWNASVSSWQEAWVKNPMDELDSARFPGLYTLTVPAGSVDYSAGFPGYVVLLEESTTDLVQHLGITPLLQASHNDLTEDHLIPGSFGELQVVTKGLCQGNQRLKNALYDVNNRLVSADLVVYASPEGAEGDLDPLATFAISAEYDTNGNMTTYLSYG